MSLPVLSRRSLSIVFTVLSASTIVWAAATDMAFAQLSPVTCGGADHISCEDIDMLNIGSEWWKPDIPTAQNACNNVAAPPITDAAALAKAIDTYITSHNGQGSPLEGLGDRIVAGASRAGVNPLLVVAIAERETSFGIGNFPPSSFNAFGRPAGTGDPTVIGSDGHSYYKWTSWAISVDDANGKDEPSYIKNNFISGDVTAVVAAIASSSAKTDPEGYKADVASALTELITDAGDAIDCTTGGSAVDPGTAAPGNPTGNQAIGKQLAEQLYGWTGNEWTCLYNLWMGESSWNERADNPSSDAYGIPQALPGSKMASAGADWKTNPATQIKWGLQYIKERYRTPCGAWSIWNSRNPHWY